MSVRPPAPSLGSACRGGVAPPLQAGGNDQVHGVWRAAPIALGEWGPVLLFAVGIPLALSLAITAPLALTTVGLIAFGLAHNVFELRYLAGRYLRWYRPRVIGAIVGLVTLVLLRRILGGGEFGDAIEIVACYGLIALAALSISMAWWPARLGALILVAGGAWASLSHPSLHFLALTHLHNLLPLAFLWLWSAGSLPPAPRAVFRFLQVSWATLVPGLLFLGAFDGWTPQSAWPEAVLGNRLEAAVHGLTLPEWREGALPGRLLQTFAFLQSMHYLTWCGLLSRPGPELTGWVDRTVEAAGGPGPRWFWSMLVVSAGALALALVADYQQGRQVYAALATYHAYIELAILAGHAFGLVASRGMHARMERT